MGIAFSLFHRINFELFIEKLFGKSTSVMSEKENVNSSENAIKASEKIWKSFGTLNLTVNDKNIIKEVFSLNDNIINCALFLLKQQFPEVKGLQNVSLNDIDLLEPIESGIKFVEIMNLMNEGLDHWIVVSNMMTKCPEREIIIYDSDYRPDQKYSVECNHAIIKLMNDLKDIKVIVQQVSQQEYINESGLYAIAFAHTLCSGADPSNILFACFPPILRQHLIDCFKYKSITRFPNGKACNLLHCDDIKP